MQGEQQLDNTAITEDQGTCHEVEQGANGSTTTTSSSEEGVRGCDIIAENLLLLTQVSIRGYLVPVPNGEEGCVVSNTSCHPGVQEVGGC